MKLIRFIICLTAMVVVGQVRPLAADEVKTNVVVEVIIFSGRPNPTWQLQDTKALDKLRVKMKDLPEAFNAEPPAWSRLGFAGFRVRNAEAFGLPSQFRLYQGVINTGHGKAAKYLKDLTRLEQSLIDESKKQPLEPAVRAALAQYESARKATQ